METVFQILAPAILFVASLMGYGELATTPEVVTQQVLASVELGLREVSPLGEKGGFAIPASGCSALDPNWGDGSHPTPPALCSSANPIITATPSLVRPGSPVTVSWDPNGLNPCSLSDNVTVLTGGLNPVTPVDANSPGSRIDIVTGQITYAILCYSGTSPYYVDVTVKVLPVVQET